MKTVKAGALEVAYLESGPSAAPVVVLLHGFPYDVHAYDEVARQLALSGRRVIVPYLRGFGATRFVDVESPRVGQQAALGNDVLALLDALGISHAILAGYDWGGRAACVVAALHPERVTGLVSGGGYNIQNSTQALEPVDPETERRHWYWYYQSTERGALALSHHRSTYCRYLWQTFSPTWRFDDATYLRTAASFGNPDFVAIALHSYRYRIGAVAGDATLDAVERQLSTEPVIMVPSIVLAGADDGVDPPADPRKVEAHFSSLRRQSVLRGVGHNIPQEAPDAFAAAIGEVGA